MPVTAEKSVERPILFRADMVRAILSGRKTQTRRVVKVNAELRGRGCTSLDGSWVDPGFGDGQYLKVPGPDETSHRLYCPKGYKGDKLWVRETFRTVGRRHRGTERRSVLYPATCPPGTVKGPLKPSIFMPRWASRLTLEITDVRVERLWEITEADAKAEGIDMATALLNTPATRREGYKMLWTEINGDKWPNGWPSNPRVWVISFKRILS